MFSSLRSRLWFSYAFVILGALLLTAVTLIVYLVRSPLVYRPTLLELDAAREVILSSQPDLSSLPPEAIQSTLESYDQTLKVRLLVFSTDRKWIADSRAGLAAPFDPPRLYRLLHPALGLRDANGKYWLFVAKPLNDRLYLVVATPRQRVPLLSLIRNDLFLPFAYAGSIALLLSMFLAYGLSRWIGNPLQRLVNASRQMPEAKPVPLRGPREVQELTHAFNEMTARVQSTQRSQRDFVANVSHELKTPLTSIQGFAQALQDGTASTPEARQQAAGIIQAEAERMNRMVLDLLDLARIDSGTLELERLPIDLPALLHSLTAKFGPQAHAAQVSLHVDAAPLPALTGDADRLAQAFMNLVDNAIKFTPPGGSITLRAKLAEARIQVEVSDTGAGIPPEALAHIFDRFYQADPSRPGGRKHGAGLGLSIVKEIIAAHGGKITVRSAPGEGSTFTITLPLTNPQASTVVSKRKK
jgi:two-component system OmpR family sensor kinase